MQVVYADVLWLIDFSMDLLSLGAAGRLMQRPSRGWRLCTAAAVGGLYSVFSLFLPPERVWILLLDMAVAAGMVWLAFGSSPPGRFALTYGCFCLVSFLLGGSMTAICNLTANLLGRAAGEGVAGGGFWLLALAGSALTLFGTRLRRRALPRLSTLYVRLGKAETTVRALCDSGNLLCDPMTGQGVIFLARRELAAVCGRQMCEILFSGDVSALSRLPEADAKRVRVIPAGTVQGKSLVLALRPDAVRVDGSAVRALIAPAPLEEKADYAAVVPAAYLVRTERMD